jgi:phospholipase/lecithinase/hemolysin
MRIVLLLASICLAVTGAASRAQAYSALYVFGDSLSDVGNDYLGSGGVIPGAPYASGRFTNGPNWVDDLSVRMGLGLSQPALAGGTNYAFGGAVTGPAIPGPSVVPNLGQQVGLFSLVNGGVAPSSALYAVWIGANDIYNALDGLLANTLTLPQAVAGVAAAAQTTAGAVAALASEGAESFLISLVPDLGVTPDVTDVAGLAPYATGLSEVYNAALVAAMQALTASEPDVFVHYLDTFTLVDAAVADPAAFGLTDATHRCYIGPLTGGGSVCATPDTYLFWDGQHPTAIAHALVAEAAATAIPEPPAQAALLAAFGALVAIRLRSRATARATA